VCPCGQGFFIWSFGTTYNSEALHNAIKDAYNHGILLVASTGNPGLEDENV
jgi:hypothetical protein